MNTYIVERYWPGVTVDGAHEALRRVGDQLRLEAPENPVRHIHSVLIPAEEVVFSEFEADSLEAVREAIARAQVPFDRIQQAVPIGSLAQGGEGS